MNKKLIVSFLVVIVIIKSSIPDYTILAYQETINNHKKPHITIIQNKPIAEAPDSLIPIVIPTHPALNISERILKCGNQTTIYLN